MDPVELELEILRAENAALAQRITTLQTLMTDSLPSGDGVGLGKNQVKAFKENIQKEQDGAEEAAKKRSEAVKLLKAAPAKPPGAAAVAAVAPAVKLHGTSPSLLEYRSVERMKSRTITLAEFKNLKMQDNSSLFTSKGVINLAALVTLLKSDSITPDMFDLKSDEIFTLISERGKSGASTGTPQLLAVVKSILDYFSHIFASAAPPAAAAEAKTPTVDVFVKPPTVDAFAKKAPGGGGVGGGGRFDNLKKLQKSQNDKTEERDEFFNVWYRSGTPPLPGLSEQTNFKKTDANYKKAQRELDLINEDLKKLMSKRNPDLSKIDIIADMITEAVSSISTSGSYTIPYGFPLEGNAVSSLPDLRLYILENIKNDAVLLTLMTTNLGLNLNAVLPEYNPVVVEVQPQSKLVDGMLVLIDENNTEYSMPNFQGGPTNRQEFSRVYHKDTCYGFGPAAYNPTCTALLLDCINGDPKQCRELLSKDKFEEMIVADMKHTNVFMIAKLLDNIGYPRVEGGIKFDPVMDHWYSKIQTFFALDVNDLIQKQTLENIQKNENLKLALTHMIRKYNKYANVINKTNSQLQLSSLAAVYGQGTSTGGNAAALLAYDGYNTTGGNAVDLLDGRNRNFNAIFKMAKELKDQSDLTKEYTKLFTTAELNIKRNNIVLSDDAKLQYKNTLESFKSSEVKLNKLLQLFTNFAFLLNTDDKTDTSTNAILDRLLTIDHMEKYVAARDKIINSLKKKQTNMTILLGPMGPMYIQQ